MPRARDRRSTDGERLAETRERFLTADSFEPNQVRDTILASWWRSRQWNVAADRIELNYIRDPDLDTPLTRNALPVLGTCATTWRASRSASSSPMPQAWCLSG